MFCLADGRWERLVGELSGCQSAVSEVDLVKWSHRNWSVEDGCRTTRLEGNECQETVTQFRKKHRK